MESKKPLGLAIWLSLTIFVSAFLLFQVQPLISKFILPWFGGSPAVWTTAMLFFQCTLFLGYVYSHLLASRLKLSTQVKLHVVLLALASIMAIFVIPISSLKPQGNEDPTSRILMLLTLCVGLPYFVLSTTGPLIQAWFSRAFPGGNPDGSPVSREHRSIHRKKDFNAYRPRLAGHRSLDGSLQHDFQHPLE